jgi:hypothetical protein
MVLFFLLVQHDIRVVLLFLLVQHDIRDVRVVLGFFKLWRVLMELMVQCTFVNFPYGSWKYGELLISTIIYPSSPFACSEYLRHYS